MSRAFTASKSLWKIAAEGRGYRVLVLGCEVLGCGLSTGFWFCVLNRFWVVGLGLEVEHLGVKTPAATLDDVRAAVAAGADLDLRYLFEGSGLWMLGIGFRV